MPSAEYYWRQADLCMRLSLLSDDREAARLLVLKALELLAQAEVAAQAIGSGHPPSESGRT